MNPEETIRTSIWNYPVLWFESGRAGVLEHMFFVLGNGYDWVDGEIVAYWDDDDREGYDPYPGKDDEISNRLRDEYNVKAAHVRENIETYVTGPGMPRSLYPLYNSAMIITMPDDVTDEWLAVAVEAYNIYGPLYRSAGYFSKEVGDRLWPMLNSIRTRLLTLCRDRGLDLKVGI